MFYLLRLILPIRGLQARLLDSGEGDRMVYRPSTNDDTDPGNTTDHWVPNTGPYATRPGDRRPDQGFLRRIWDGDTGRHFTGLYITTNKTQDRESLFTESGYEIPWENPDIVALFTRLRDWQERYNPSTGGLSRAMLSDPHLAVSADVAARLPRLHFLFRDAASPTTPQEPPTTGRTGVFWHLLVNELERRLAAQGERNDDGTPIRLITKKSETGYPSGTVFDPHSLRVSGLTALAGAGVPIHILSQFVAGHATVLMTLYYQKPGAAEITRILDAAVADVAEGEQRDWDRHLKSRPLELLHDIAAYNDPSALTGARETQSSLWAPMDDGICPNAGSRCSEGGPVINIGKGIHAPVPGGPRNCAMCRFFVTGPAFLGGLVARFNSTAGRIRESLGRLQETEARRRELTTARAAAATAGQPWAGQRDMARAEEAIATTQQELELLSQTWMAQLRLIKRSEAILAEGHQRALGQRHGAALATPETKTPPMPAGTVSPEGAKKGKGGARGAQAGSGQGSATGHDSATGPGGGRSHPGGAKAPNDAAGEGQNGDEIRNALVLNGSGADLLVALEECSEFALWDRICQSSEFYPGVDARLPAIRRARLFDAVFAREGLPAVYATLSDDQILAIGNAMSRLLHTRVSQSEADALTRGETTLERLGLTASDLLPPETPLPGPLTLTPAAVRRQLPPLTMS